MLNAERERVISKLVKLVNERQLSLGKIQLQKLVYFLQNDNVDLGYRYTFYHYGPYSAELASDLDTLNTLGVVQIQAVDDGYGYHISSGAVSVSDNAPSEVSGEDVASRIISSVIDKFGSCDASGVELRATIHYVHGVLGRLEATPVSASEFRGVIERAVRQLKPKFTAEQIHEAYDELLELGYLGN